jgi:hypothetical protein
MLSSFVVYQTDISYNLCFFQSVFTIIFTINGGMMIKFCAILMCEIDILE